MLLKLSKFLPLFPKNRYLKKIFEFFVSEDYELIDLTKNYWQEKNVFRIRHKRRRKKLFKQISIFTPQLGI